MEVDMRSEDAKSLATVDAQVQRILRDALTGENARWKGQRAESARLTLRIDTIGIRPTGAQADDAPIIQTALVAAKALGFTSSTSASSTDANFPISLGIPAMRIGGGGSAEGAHSLGEWYDDGPNGYLGPQWAALIVAALAGVHQ
jgi:acetylornithine deacetylase/succinyl-diaminopimelate desuccinylase-like protein